MKSKLILAALPLMIPHTTRYPTITQANKTIYFLAFLIDGIYKILKKLLKVTIYAKYTDPIVVKTGKSALFASSPYTLVKGATKLRMASRKKRSLNLFNVELTATILERKRHHEIKYWEPSKLKLKLKKELTYVGYTNRI